MLKLIYDLLFNYIPKLTFWLVCLFVCHIVVAKADPHITFQSLQEGLSNQVITCMLKDYKGYMWIGTYSGLNRYDGSDFVVYEHNLAGIRTISHNVIGAIIEDKSHKLWVGTSNGLNIYNRDKDRFELVPGLGRTDTLNVRALFCDKKDNIWIGTAGDGLFMYDQRTSKLTHFTHNPSNPHSICSDFVKAIIADREGNLWIGTRDGLDRLEAKSKQFTHFVSDANLSSKLSNNAISSLTIDAQGTIWIGTYGGGLNKLMKKQNTYCFQHFRKNKLAGSLSNDIVLSLLLDQKGGLWVGTENGGLNYLLPESDKFVQYKSEEGNPQSLSSNSIWSLYEDNNGLLWIGTYYKGLNIYDAHAEKFQSYQRNAFSKQTLVNNQVRAFAEDEAGNLWIATDGGGINYFNTQNRQFTEPIVNASLSSKAILSILYDSRHTLWLGSWGAGVDHYTRNGTRLNNYRFDGLLKNKRYNISTLYEDKAGQIWAGTSGNGLFVYKPDKDCFVQVLDESNKTHLNKSAYISALLQDKQGQLWVGTLYGLICMKPEKEGKYSFQEYLYNADPRKGGSSFAINTLFEDRKGNLWIGTMDDLNLFHPENGSFTVFTKEDGLPGSTIRGIVEDPAGNLWISTNKGLSMFNPSKSSFKNYFKEDGLVTNEFYPNAFIQMSNGEFFLGGNNGISSFLPTRMTTNHIVPPVYITEFNLFNTPAKIGQPGSPLEKSISETTHITLTHKQTSFSIEFVALNFTHSSKNQYAYMLEGFDKEWNQVGTQRMATYTNLDAGTYIFKVKGSNNEGIWNKTPTTLQITILPPIWATKWAYILYVLLFSALLWTFIKLKMNQIAQAQKLEMEQLTHAKQEELNRMKEQFFTNVSHELRTPLTLILSPLEQIISHGQVEGEVKDKIRLVYTHAERLNGLVNELMDFSKLEESKLKIRVQKEDICRCIQAWYTLFAEQARQRQIDYQFVYPAQTIEAWFDKNKMEKIVLNLISNAFKYTPERGTIQVGIELIQTKVDLVDSNHPLSYSPGHIRLWVADNGSGIGKEYIGKIFDRFFQSPEDETQYNTGTGIGLALVKNLVELHHGIIQVSSEKGIRTCFEVLLPLGNSHFESHEIITNNTDPIQCNTTGAVAEITSESPKAPEINSSRIIPLSSMTSTRDTAAQAPVILIVEDNAELRKYLAAIFSEEYRILEAADGDAGFRLATEQIPDLIISDILMPRCGGIDLCQKVKTDMRISHIPVLLLTAKTSVSDQIAGVENGADVYVTKPFNTQLLLVQIHQLIHSRRELYAHFSQDVYLRPNRLADNELDEQFLQKVIGYILQNLTDSNLSVEGLAESVNLSRSNMYRKLKALTGTSVIEFIRIIRLKEALKLMETKKHSLAEIAYLTGFTSPAYFTKSFKEHYGKPPSEYLKAS
ncbi:two-component regulator propeller domain-containing protein [Xanthocytophaga flavus]|uniref:hybrid sensor histidine kinase/response regulator transcription factor n=1 Tax=Xanthocytophaga flava TaxID=3048013 RepID=UPI0028D04829|nr:two-component regulator propeller domain-containing protein [Xanthocytophaga flavus]